MAGCSSLVAIEKMAKNEKKMTAGYSINVSSSPLVTNSPEDFPL